MKHIAFHSSLALGLVASLAAVNQLRAEELAPQYRGAIQKGLEWVAKQQHRDGHWEANGGQYPSAMTALAGMALLMEGSTLREGKYCNNIRRAVDWLTERSQRNGPIHGPGIKKREPEPLRQTRSDATFTRPSRSIDSNNHS